jgi:multiple sugar transport system ATP-binding protein
MASVHLVGLSKQFDSRHAPALDGLTLEVRDGEFLVLVGPSGCGKSTALRLIAGLEVATAGDVYIGDRCVTHVPPAKRDVAMVFQNYALYPHLTVGENIGFGLKMRRVAATEAARRVQEAADRLSIADLLGRRPSDLSGGQRQRVALARAIVRAPQVFLFDEPLSNLDAKLRVETRAELLGLHRALGATMIYVTHDQIEAMTMGQRVAVLSEGRLRQLGTPAEVYARPADTFVARFLGSPGMNVLPGEVFGDRREVLVGLRPEALKVRKRGGTGGGAKGDGGTVVGTVELVEPLGAETLIHVRLASGDRLVVRRGGMVSPRVGEELEVTFDTTDLHLFDSLTERRVE